MASLRNIKPVPLSTDYHERKPWERLETEGPEAYRAFCIYRDLEADERVIVNAYRIYAGRKAIKQISGYFQKWSYKFRWRERVQLYDDHLDSIRRKAKEREIEKAAARHVKQCSNFGLLLNKVEKALLARMETNPTLRGVATKDLIAQAIRGASIVPKLQEAEMTALGKPTRIEVTGEGGGPIAVRHIAPVLVEAAKPEDAAEPDPDSDDDES